MAEPRVLVYISANQTCSTERVMSMGISRARETIDSGMEDRNSWFYGAKVIESKDYELYGYKECPRNGVVRDDTAKHYTLTQLERMKADSNRDTLTDATEASMKVQMEAMMSKMAEMQIQMDKSSQQRDLEATRVSEQRAADLEAAQAPKKKLKKPKSKE